MPIREFSKPTFRENCRTYDTVTGSLATILWLTALRRENIQVGAWQFLKLGAVVMPVALVLALAGVFVLG